MTCQFPADKCWQLSASQLSQYGSAPSPSNSRIRVLQTAAVFSATVFILCRTDELSKIADSGIIMAFGLKQLPHPLCWDSNDHNGGCTNFISRDCDDLHLLQHVIRYTKLVYTVHIGIWLGNNHGNFQLHRFTRSKNIAKSFGGYFFLLSLYVAVWSHWFCLISTHICCTLSVLNRFTHDTWNES